jgi:phosphoglycerol transferase MdoB-like AlkP superfamily enzyme
MKFLRIHSVHNTAAPLTNSFSSTHDAFKQQLKTSAFFLLFTLLILGISRTFILFFIADWQQTSSDELFLVLYTGLRFDLKLAAVCIILFTLLPIFAILLFNRWRWILQINRFSLLAIILACLIFSFIDVGFYFFFGTAISNLIFGIIDDGFYAVMLSIISDWRLNLLIVLAAISAFFISKSFLSLTNISSDATKSTINKAIILVITMVLIAICGLFGRGTLDTFPLSRRTIVINDNPIMNALPLNGPYHFYYAYKDLKEDSFSSLTPQKILQKAKTTSLQQLTEAAGYSDQSSFKAHSSKKASSFTQPNVIFVLMEGWSSHIAQQQSSDNQVLGEFAKHAEQDYFFKRFFSDEYGTNPTIEKLLLNAPMGPITQSIANTHSFSLSNIVPFKQQGYSTLFLSGGNSAWRKHGQFWPRQGFDRYLGRATIEKHFGEVSDNPWGVYDNYLFQYLQTQLIQKEAGKPLFSFVLTTNNHAPIKLPENYQAPPLNPAKYGFEKDDAKKFESLTGYHFQSEALGQFLSWLKQSDYADNTIVVATGDHVLKGFANYSATEQSYNRYAVATYLYVPQALDQLEASDQWQAGSHKDLFPTLFELALDDAPYLNFGETIMQKSPENAIGINEQGSYIFDQGISNDGEHLQLFKKPDSNQLSNEKRPLSDLQKKLVKQQSYIESLQKYLLVDDLNNDQ